jgi:hypothetical protein
MKTAGEDYSIDAYFAFERRMAEAIHEAEKFERKIKHIKQTAKKNSITSYNLNAGYYYVYLYVLDNEVKYVGKGSYSKRSVGYERACDIYGHNDECRKNAHKIRVVIEKHFKTEKAALAHESELIEHYGLENLWNVKG